jgi:hypothetical protein
MAAVEQTLTSPGYLIDTYQCAGCHEWLATVTGTPAAHNVALTETDLGPTTDSSPSEPSVPGGSIGGGDLDGRTLNAVYEKETSDNKPVLQYAAMDACSTGTCIVSGRVDLSGASPVRVSEQTIGSSGWDYTYGAVGLDAAGHVFETYSRSNASTTPEAAVTGPGFDFVFQPSVSGTTSCPSGQTAPCDERWGDYLGTSSDPSDPGAVWISGLYQATSGGFGWGTTIAKVSTSTTGLPVVSGVSPPSGPVAGGTTITVSGSGFKPHGAPAVSSVALAPTNGGSPLYATGINVTSDSSLTAVTPNATSEANGSALTADVRVTSNGLDSLTSSADRFTFTQPPVTISSVVFKGKPSSPKVTVTGSGFGTKPAGSLPCGKAKDGMDFGSNGLWLSDTTVGFTAGQVGDCVGLTPSTYTATKIVMKLGSYYKKHFSAFATGDAFTVTVLGTSFSGTVKYG